MATYYVSPSGSDTNNGLGPDASHATNKPWLTIGKALGASGISSGDTVYIAPGVYRETVTVAMTSATAETKVLGDPANAQGFKNGSGVLLDPRVVRWTAHTTNDTTAPAAANLLNLSGRDFLTFENLLMEGGDSSNSCVAALTLTSTNIKFTNCVLKPWGGATVRTLVNALAAFGVSLSWTFSRCLFLLYRGGSPAMSFSAATGTGSDYDLGVLIENCVGLWKGAASASVFFVSITSSGIDPNEGNGVTVRNCSFFGGGVQTLTTRLSLSFPSTVKNSVISAVTAFSSSESGNLTEDWNVLYATTLRTNVDVGANSKDNAYRLAVHQGEEQLWGFFARMPFEPVSGSPFLGFGDDGNAPAVDLLGRNRPAGGGSTAKAAGALERGDTGVRETTTVRTGSNALKVAGPGYHNFFVPVDATETTVTVYGRFDAAYAGTKPQLKVLNGSEVGVSDATATMTGAANTWEQLSLTFTPTRAGVVTIQLVSSSTAAGGNAFFDDFDMT